MNRIVTNIFHTARCGRLVALVVSAGLGFLVAASSAKAGCAPIPYAKGATSPISFASAHAADYQQGEDSNALADIVGLWHLIYTGETNNNFPPGSPIPPPFQFLESFKTWHADGTEFENAFLPPAGGDICFGVWKDLGHSKVKLHHIGLMFGGPGATPPEDVSNIFTVDETDTVALDGKTYSGFFDFKLYAPSNCANSAGGYVCTGTPISEVTGTTYGVRIGIE